MESQGTILLIDKPTGMTSHDVVAIIRKRTGVKRVGHAGTLDPLATGLLILLVGREATKRQSEFLKQDKKYLCTARLGVTTDTYDSEGKVTTEVNWDEVAKIFREDVEMALKKFAGEIEQTVPAFSAVKIKGQKLYDQARKGKVDVTTLPSRNVTIYSLELREFHKDEALHTLDITLEVHCSSGTYIRSLVHDIGQVLKVGATVTALRRTQIGELRIEDAQPLKMI